MDSQRQTASAAGSGAAASGTRPRGAARTAVALVLFTLGLLAGLTPRTAQAQPTVRIDSDLVPAELRVGEQFRLLFVTSTTRDARPRNLGPYQDFVRSRARAGHPDIRGFADGFIAIACSNWFGDPVTAAGMSQWGRGGAPIYWVNGPKAADFDSDFWDGSWDSTSGRTESGAASAPARVWTGCANNGWPGRGDLGLGGESGRARTGSLQGGGSPVDRGRSDRGSLLPLYALSPLLTVGPPPYNTPPAFSDNQNTTFSLPENTIVSDGYGQYRYIGEPVVATDPDRDILRYGLEGPDAASFGIESSTGQLMARVGVTYDFETKPSYSFRVTVDDARGGTDAIDITIALTDEPEPRRTPWPPRPSGRRRCTAWRSTGPRRRTTRRRRSTATACTGARWGFGTRGGGMAASPPGPRPRSSKG